MFGTVCKRVGQSANRIFVSEDTISKRVWQSANRVCVSVHVESRLARRLGLQIMYTDSDRRLSYSLVDWVYTRFADYQTRSQTGSADTQTRFADCHTTCTGSILYTRFADYQTRSQTGSADTQTRIADCRLARRLYSETGRLT